MSHINTYVVCKSRH